VARGSDRYEPLPPINQLPAFVWRRLGRAGRATLVGALAALALAAVLIVPDSRESAREERAREARAERERKERRLRVLRAQVRPRRATAGSVPDVERAITRDARRRTGKRILRTDCERKAAPAGEQATSGGRVALSCLAVRAEFAPSEATTGGRLGYPYAALAQFSSDRASYCRVFGIPAEGGLTRRQEVTIPPACGGRG